MRDLDSFSTESTDASRFSVTPDSMGFGERGSIKPDPALPFTETYWLKQQAKNEHNLPDKREFTMFNEKDLVFGQSDLA